MDARKFNNYMPFVHHDWAAEVLGMDHNRSNQGPDLTYNDGEGGKCCVELKWALVPKIEPMARYPKAWTVDEDQMSYPDTYGTGYWGLGLYTLSVPVSEITDNALGRLENYVTDRQLWLVRWGWMNKYPPSYVSGKTSKSEWSTYLRYPKFKDRPPTKKTHNVIGGKIHVTSWVPDEYFFPPEEEGFTHF